MKPISDLLAFIPDGWIMPLGFEQLVEQMKDPEYYTGECERLRKLCQKSKGNDYAKYNVLWSIAAKYLAAARYERDIADEMKKLGVKA